MQLPKMRPIFSLFLFVLTLGSAAAEEEDRVDRELLRRVQQTVRRNAAKFEEMQSNCSFKLRGNDASRLEYVGTCRMMGRSILIDRQPGFRKEQRHGVRGLNSQYGFSISKNDSGDWSLDRVDINASEPLPAIRVVLLGEVMAWTNAYMLYDVPLLDIIEEKEGKVVALSQEKEDAVIAFEFQFRENHPYRHSTATIHLDAAACCVRDYRLTDLPVDGSKVVSQYDVQIDYTKTGPDAFLTPMKYQFRSRGSDGDKILVESPLIVAYIEDVELGKCDPRQFTLTEYGIPEPPGTTVLKSPFPYWLTGMAAGIALIGGGVYLRRRRLS